VSAKVMTANRLRDGDVVYLAEDGRWSERLEDAWAVESEAAEAGLAALAEQAVAERLVVAPYLMPVAAGDAGPLPLSQRERIRALGPTVRLDLGKQAM